MFLVACTKQGNKICYSAQYVSEESEGMINISCSTLFFNGGYRPIPNRCTSTQGVGPGSNKYFEIFFRVRSESGISDLKCSLEIYKTLFTILFIIEQYTV